MSDMSDSLLTSNDREEALSWAYVAAVAAGAGYTLSQSNFDRDGIDVQIGAGGDFRPSIGVQLKATINLGDPHLDRFRFPLKLRNYDLLRIRTQVPRILVVLRLPKNEQDWLSVTPDNLILRRCAYWVSLTGLPETDNQETITVDIPESALFDVDSLRSLMEKARTGAVA